MNESNLKCNCLNCQEKKIEQPNQNLMIIEEIEELMSQVNKKLYKLPNIISIRALAIEKLNLLQTTTLFELRKIFE